MAVSEETDLEVKEIIKKGKRIWNPGGKGLSKSEREGNGLNMELDLKVYVGSMCRAVLEF
jgi:hypothetical protein